MPLPDKDNKAKCNEFGYKGEFVFPRAEMNTGEKAQLFEGKIFSGRWYLCLPPTMNSYRIMYSQFVGI
jgi:hypothetical protein